MRRALAQLRQGGLESTHQAQEGLRNTPGRPLPIRIRQHAMTEEVVEHFALDRYFQLPGVGPVQLQQLPRVAILRKEHLPLRALGRPPVAHPPEKGAQMTLLQPAVRASHKILEEGLGFQLRRIPQHPGNLLPNLIQRIGPCPPCVLGLQFCRALARLNIFTRRVTIHVRLHRAVR